MQKGDRTSTIFTLAYTTLGEIQEASGDHAADRDAFVQALEISQQFFLAHAYLGQLYSEYCWLDEAVFHYGQALDLKPDLHDTL